jgi:ubiquitin fusion degradation protein 1
MAPGAERPELNYGSKIFLPPSALDKVSRLHVQWPIMLELINGATGKHTHAGVLEFVAEEGRAYIPQWVCLQKYYPHCLSFAGVLTVCR